MFSPQGALIQIGGFDALVALSNTDENGAIKRYSSNYEAHDYDYDDDNDDHCDACVVMRMSLMMTHDDGGADDAGEYDNDDDDDDDDDHD